MSSHASSTDSDAFAALRPRLLYRHALERPDCAGRRSAPSQCRGGLARSAVLQRARTRRAALRWTEIVTAIPHSDASDAEFASLQAQFSDAEIAELGFAIATINAWNLLNVSLRSPVPERP